jgi:hypothetical protein
VTECEGEAALAGCGRIGLGAGGEASRPPRRPHLHRAWVRPAEEPRRRALLGARRRGRQGGRRAGRPSDLLVSATPAFCGFGHPEHGHAHAQATCLEQHAAIMSERSCDLCGTSMQLL